MLKAYKYSCGLSLIALLPKESVAFVANPLASKPPPSCAHGYTYGQGQGQQQCVGPLAMMKGQKEPFFFANTIMMNNSNNKKEKTSTPSSTSSLPMMTGNDFPSAFPLLTEESSYTQNSRSSSSSTTNSNQFSPEQYQEQGRRGRQHHKNNFFFNMFADKDDGKNINEIEKEIWASTQAKLDIKRIKNAFFQDDNAEDDIIDVNSGSTTRAYTTASASSSSNKAIDAMVVSVEKDEKEKTNSVFETVTTITPNPSNWSIAIASGAVLGLLSFIALQLPMLSFSIFLLTTYVASRDPTLDEDLVAGDLTGPATRTLGRMTLDAVETVTPTFKAVMRAIISGDELIDMKSVNRELMNENDDLRMEIARKEAIEDLKKHYTVKQLKEIAKRDGLKVSGNKFELMMRLLENDSIPLQSPVKN